MEYVNVRNIQLAYITTYIDCILYIDCSICFTIVHMVAFVNLILKKMMNEWMNEWAVQYRDSYNFGKWFPSKKTIKIELSGGERIATIRLAVLTSCRIVPTAAVQIDERMLKVRPKLKVKIKFVKRHKTTHNVQIQRCLASCNSVAITNDVYRH